jgi:hypothetical protein
MDIVILGPGPGSYSSTFKHMYVKLNSTSNQCCGSGSTSRNLFFPSRIRIKEFKYCNTKKWFLSSRKYDPDCSSWIPDPGVKKAPDPGFGSATLLQIIFSSIFQASEVNIFLVVGVLTRQHTLYVYKTP